MALEDLTSTERQVALRTVWLVAATDLIEDDELHTVTGFERHELLEIHRQLANARGELDEDAMRAVGQCLNNLTGYPHGQDALVEKELGCSMEHLARISAKWFGTEKYFERWQ